MKTSTRLLAAAALCALPMSANAAVIHTVKDGKLTGATGVTVGTKTYDVSFVVGTCAEVFGKCESSSFDLNETNYIDAVKALSEQVFVDTANFKFDSDPGLTSGCTGRSDCTVVVPIYRGPFNGEKDTVVFGFVANETLERFDDAGSLYRGLHSSGSATNGVAFARFTLAGSGDAAPPEVAGAVPEPATWALMLAGFGMTGAALRRRRVRFAAA